TILFRHSRSRRSACTLRQLSPAANYLGSESNPALTAGSCVVQTGQGGRSCEDLMDQMTIPGLHRSELSNMRIRTGRAALLDTDTTDWRRPTKAAAEPSATQYIYAFAEKC
ncbi:unnamed protein product, partial [Mycena citricolor]